MGLRGYAPVTPECLSPVGTGILSGFALIGFLFLIALLVAFTNGKGE